VQSEALEGVEARIAALRAQVERVVAATRSGRSPADVRGDAERLAGLVEALAADTAAERRRLAADSAQMTDVLEAIYAVAALDFSRRAEIRGDGPLDAIAVSINMLAEELDEAQRRLVEAKASAEAATVAKSRFLAQMSHEIRTPLTALLGFADILAAPSLGDSDRINYAMIVRRNGEHLLSVINDILDLSRIEAQRLQLEPLDCSPVQILADIESLMRARATERGLDFEVRLDSPVPAVLRTDPTRLRQVLLNVIGNAIKFTERGSVRVLVRFDPLSSLLRVDVVDTGIGMTPEQLARLFRPFEQADLSMTRRFGGSGLGLAISRGLAVALGGEITVASAPGEGSRFSVALPVQVAAGVPLLAELSAARRAAAAAPVPAAAFSGNVLLAEDGPDNQILVTTLLRQLGLSVAVAANGEVAVERALGAWRGGTPYDLVFMDMQMPVMDGYEATRQLRAARYPGPVVALTAHAMEGERERCVGAGCDEYVRKPIERSNLLEVLGRFLPPVMERAVTEAPAPLVSTMADDPDMTELVARFVERLPGRAGAIQEATRTADPSLRRLVHGLKGAAGGYGFAPITEAAARLERALVGGAGPAAVAHHADEIVDLCARARAKP
jgi:signal transduction histidine kinase/CheY-like chemotaxis protein/HPt (histidine-containing phosphotransfer) domain-containing protein